MEVTLRRDRKAGLDDIHAHGVQEFGDLQLLLEGHGGTRALLAVAQRRVEDEDLVGVGVFVRTLHSGWYRLARISHDRWSLSVAAIGADTREEFQVAGVSTPERPSRTYAELERLRG